jgi:hypothetical protein
MSLNLNYTGIANWEDVCLIDDPTIGRKVEHPFNFTMGILLMHTGINTITRQNASEFYMRAKLIEACCGALFTNALPATWTPRTLPTTLASPRTSPPTPRRSSSRICART